MIYLLPLLLSFLIYILYENNNLIKYGILIYLINLLNITFINYDVLILIFILFLISI